MSPDELMVLLEDVKGLTSDAVPENELLALLDELWEHFVRVQLPSTGNEQLDLVASAWLAYAYRQARAVGVLTRQGMKDAAVANARVAFEHAIYLSLIADGRDSQPILDALEKRFLYIQRKLAESIPGAQTVIPLLASMADDLDVPDRLAWVRSVEQVCEKLDTGAVVYDHYRVLSSEMHPGLGSAIPYMFPSPQSRKLAEQPFLVYGDIALSVAVGSCAWAGWSADALFRVELFGPVVAKAARRLQYTPLVRLSD